MNKLMKLSLDWFTYLIPPLPVTNSRISFFDIDEIMFSPNLPTEPPRTPVHLNKTPKVENLASTLSSI